MKKNKKINTHRHIKRRQKLFLSILFVFVVIFSFILSLSLSQKQLRQSFAAAGTCIYSENDSGTINCYEGTGATGFNGGCHYDPAVGVQKQTCPGGSSSGGGSAPATTTNNTATAGTTPGCTYSENDNGVINCYTGMNSTGIGFNDNCKYDPAIGVKKLASCPSGNTTNTAGGTTGGTTGGATCTIANQYNECTFPGSACATQLKGTGINAHVIQCTSGTYQCTTGGTACRGAANAATNTAATTGKDGCIYSQKNSNGTTSCYEGMNPSGSGFNNSCLYDPKLGVKPVDCPGATTIVPGAIDGCLYTQKNSNGTTSCYEGKNSSGTGIDNNCVYDPTLGIKLKTCPGAANPVVPPAGTGTTAPAGHNSLSLHTHLQGVGNGVNADGTPENANPAQTTVTASLLVLPAQNPQQPAATDSLTYNPKTGNFENNNFNVSNIPGGEYKVMLHVDNYLNIPLVKGDGTQTLILSPEKTDTPALVSMTPGDITPVGGDNIVDIQDYNTMVSCMGQTDATICPDPKVADLNGDGVVDQKDLNLLQSHFGAIGSAFTTPKFVCTSDPNCKTGNSTMQICPLLCKMQNVPIQ